MSKTDGRNSYMHRRQEETLDELPLINPLIFDQEQSSISSSLYLNDNTRLTPQLNDNHLSRSTSPQSQVRFCIPESKEVDHSPLKIVFPNSPSQNDLKSKLYKDRESDAEEQDVKHLNQIKVVDMNSKLMLDVPEEVWKFHQQRRKHKETTSSPSKKKRPQSWQSLIAETVTSYNENNKNIKDIDARFPLNLKGTPVMKANRSTRSNLYLSPESPLNKQRIPIPLEISLPPYLSPKNKNKRHSAVIYDGEGYSQFQEEIDSISSESSESSTEESEDSIPFARHALSFEEMDSSKADTDKILGIDQEANVNLKVQNRNLRKGHEELSKQFLPPLPQTKLNNSEEKNYYGALNKSQFENESLKILKTPTKSITIPNLDTEEFQTPKSNNSNGALEFFEKFESITKEGEQQKYTQPSTITNQYNKSFKFPLENKEGLNTESSLNNSSDFADIPSNSTAANLDVEKRRKKLINEMKLNPYQFTHQHKRSKSIISLELTEASDNRTVEEREESMRLSINSAPSAPIIPVRSPLRPKSPISITEQDIETPTKLTPKNTPAERSPNTPNIYLHSCSPPRTNKDTTASVTDSFISPDVSYEEISKNIEKTNDSIQILFERKVSSDKEEKEEEEIQLPFIQASAERKEPSIKPLSSFQSFNNPLTHTLPDNLQTVALPRACLLYTSRCV